MLRAPVALCILALPLVLRVIPRNGWYGYRTGASIRSPDEWCRLNRIAGLALMGCALVSVGLKLLMVRVFEGHPGLRYVNLADAVLLSVVVVVMVVKTEQ